MATLTREAALAVEFAVDPPFFVRQVFGITPEPWQAEALTQLAAGRNVAIRSGHGVGKTAMLSWAVSWFLATRPAALVPCTAPTKDQLRDILWTELARWVQGSALREVLEWTATKLAMRGREESWFAVARTSNKPENMAGFHARHILYVIDEASGVPDTTMQVVDGALTTVGSLVLMAGNPTKRSGYFVDAFGKNRWAWHTIHVSSEDSPRVNPQWVADMARKWGRESDVYRVRVLGEPPRAEADTFISLELAEAGTVADLERHVGALALGVDVARYGDSETVIVARRGGRVIDLRPYRKRGTTEVAGLVLQCARELLGAEAPSGPIRIKVDDSGVGGGVTDALREAGREDPRLEIVACNFGGAGDAHYANATGVMWGRLRTMLADGQLEIPNDDDLIGQLTTRKYGVNAQGLIVLESKEDLRRRQLPSPDRADALALAFHEPGQAELDDQTQRLLAGMQVYA